MKKNNQIRHLLKSHARKILQNNLNITLVGLIKWCKEVSVRKRTNQVMTSSDHHHLIIGHVKKQLLNSTIKTAKTYYGLAVRRYKIRFQSATPVRSKPV